MKPLLPTSIGGLALGVVVVIIALSSWPKSYSFLTADPTPNIVGLAIGSALISIGVLAALLYIHAEAVGSNMETALTNHENRLRFEERERLEREERIRARQARSEPAEQDTAALSGEG